VRIAGTIKISPNDAIYLDLLAIMRQRIAFVEKAIPEFTELDARLADETKAATQACADLLSMNRLVSNWDPVQLVLNDTHLSTLRWFGNMVMRNHHPLAIVPQEQRDDVLNKIKEELGSLRTGEDFGWQRTALIEGLERIERVLTYFPFFGHDAACKEFFAVNLEFRAIYEQEPRRPESSSGRQKIFNALTILNTLMSLYVMPDQLATATDRYRNWRPTVVLSLPAPAPPDQKRLPAPAVVLPEEPKIEEGRAGA
jgi:hypothetical protein